MFYQKIKSYLETSDFIKQFDEVTQASSNNLIYKLNRSSKSILAVRLLEKLKKNIIFVSADNKMAEDYFEDFELLTNNDQAYYLPDFEVLPYEERSPHYTIRSQRINSLCSINSEQKNIYSTSLASFLRKMVPKKIFQKNILNLHQGMEIDIDLLVSKLVSIGYENEFQVQKVGHLSRRGGIVDIYSPQISDPVRIEFFGDEIDSIRYFSVISQRSTGETTKSVTVHPFREFSLEDIKPNKSLWGKIHDNGFYEGIEQHVSLLFGKTDSLISYFEKDDIIVIFDEFQFYSSYLKDFEDETFKLWEKARKTNAKDTLPEPNEIFCDNRKFKRIIKQNKCFFFSNSYQQFKEISNTLESTFTSQTSIQNNLELLSDIISQRQQEGFKVIIQSDNKSQMKRMIALLEDFELFVEHSIGVLQKGFNLEDAGITVLTDHEIFSRYKRRKHKSKYSQKEALADYESLEPGDYIVHIDYGIGRYCGLRKINLGSSEVECLALEYAENDTVFVPTYQLKLVTRFVAEEGLVPTIHKIGSKKWDNAKSRAKKQIELVADDILKLYAERNLRKGIKFQPDNEWQRDLEDSFIYEDTIDQARATQEIKEDMESDSPMERLLCGDVGFGKTEVAIRAAFKAVMGGYQTAILVPTTLLAEQHYLVFKERMAQFPVNIAMFSRFRSKKNMQNDIADLALGHVDIVIGTHRLLSKDIKFKKLGLLIIDEEHRFGVRQKDKIRKIKSNVDTLYMSATPIPRTLSLALSKLKELSLIQTSPKERLPVRTIVIPFDHEVIKSAILREVSRGGQVFFLHNRVQTIESVRNDLIKLMPNVRFQIGHGQLPEKQLEAIMIDFAEHKFDVLIASTIIENGIDIQNANTIIINQAQNFGLAQLYQLRGRVGRSNRRAYAYLVIPNSLTEIGRKRIETLTEYESLGAGYQIALRDMEIRGTGAILGTKQSGIINSIGFNYYNRLLNEAITNLEKENPNGIWTDEKELKKEEVRIEESFYIPNNFITDEKVRLKIYSRFSNLENLKEFDEIRKELIDRFGKLPDEAEKTILYYKLRFLSKKAKLKLCQTKAKKIILEFDQKMLPSRSKITGLLQKFDYPVSFENISNLRINFDLTKDSKITQIQLMKNAIDILSFLQMN